MSVFGSVFQSAAPGVGSSTPSGGGGGTSLYDLSPEVVDLTDGSWTLEDPDSLIDTSVGTNGVVFSAGFNTVTWNALAGTANYRWDSGATCRSPRWYKDLSIDGSNILNGDYLIQSIRLELDTAIADFYQMVVVGSGMNPTSVTLNDIRLMGGVMRRNTTGNILYGTFANNTFTGNGSSSNDFSVATHARGFTAMGTGMFLNLDSSENPALYGGQGSRNGQIVSGQPATTQMRLIIGLGIGGSTTTVSSGSQQKFAASVVSLTTNVGA